MRRWKMTEEYLEINDLEKVIITYVHYTKEYC